MRLSAHTLASLPSALQLLRALALLAVLAVPTFAAAAPQPSTDPDPDIAVYAELDNVGGAWVNLATFPVRPMVYDPDGRLWVVNQLDSTVECFSGTNTTADPIHGVPWSPVSIAYWEGAPGHAAELLVVCRGTWAVVGLDPETGKPTRLLQLRPELAALPGGLDPTMGRMAEPGDILVDEENDRAFVSCTGADSVVQIDLVENEIVRVFHQEVDAAFRLKSPLHLSWDHNGENVLVAPLHSGNNSLASPPVFASTQVEDFTPVNTCDEGLPDEDLFRIRPWVDALDPGSVEVVLRSMGTILFGHGIHPATSDFWQLNTEALNKDPNRQSEPALKGDFVENRVSIVVNDGQSWGTSALTIGLDPGDQGGLITTGNTVGQPIALAFSPASHVYVAGLLSDNVAVLDQNGQFLFEWDVTGASGTRTLPRALLQHPSSNKVVLVYCWGDNRVRAYSVDVAGGSATLQVTYDLRHDPTPPEVAAGRIVFYDGTHSESMNSSCATCHVDGASDFLVWELSGTPQDSKGPMFTQTLVGIERLAPFHWRGERQLEDFRPAFQALLGAPDDGDHVIEPGEGPSDAEFASFEAFVFSLVNPANPHQNRARVVDRRIHHPDTTFEVEDPTRHSSTIVGDALVGQQSFQEAAFVDVQRHACVDCHAFPAGTNNDINVEREEGQSPRRMSLKPTPFHELWRKQQSLVRVSKGGVEQHRAFLGSGFSHLGALGDLYRFVDSIIDKNNFTFADDQKANDVADFLHQWDQGLAPAVHFAYLLDAAADTQMTADELGYLHGEMTKRNCDIAVVGFALDHNGVLGPLRWSWDRVTSAYRSELPPVEPRQLSDFLANLSAGEANLFIGLPVGMAERFAIDYDMDGVRNRAAAERDREYNPALPNYDDGLVPGFTASGEPQILWRTTKVARLVFTTTEPTTAVIDYQEPKSGPEQVTSPRLSRHHSILLTRLRPSTSDLDGLENAEYDAEDVTYSVTVRLTDARGNLGVPYVFPLETDDFIVPQELMQDFLDDGMAEETGDELRNERSHVVQSICLGGPNCDQIFFVGSQWRADVDMQIAYKRGAWQAAVGGGYQPVPAAGRVVVGRVLVERANGTIETATSAGLTVTPADATAFLTDQVAVQFELTTYPLAGVPQPAGKFLAGLTPTDASGRTRIAFDVDPISSSGAHLGTGDRVIFNVEAVLEPDPSGTIALGSSVVTYPALYPGAFMQWSFPDTKEARSFVRSRQL